jgi:protein O-mannosyl-transferase
MIAKESLSAPPVIVAVVTFLTFLPVLRNEFSDFDDYQNLVYNPLYRGLGWTQLQWMFTTLHMGHYRPLTWVSFGFDYLIWGMNPTGYHLTSLLIHVANAVFFFFISRRLLALAVPGSNNLTLGAGFAALLFAIHPMRVEAVALASDRKELLATFFFLWVVYFYVRGRMRIALGFFVLSLLSKGIAITAPVLLLILDWYPLRRLKGQNVVPLLREKIPFALAAIPFAAISLMARMEQPGKWLSHDVVDRLGQALYSPGFFIWETVVPYRIPPHWEPSAIIAWMIAFLAVALTVFFCVLRHKFPAGWASWVFMCVSLSPVVGVVQVAPYWMADRYSYLACLPWAVLGGGLLLYSLRPKGVRRRRERRREKSDSASNTNAKVVAAVVVLLVLVPLTWERTQIWKTPLTLWMHVLAVDPNPSNVVQHSRSYEHVATILSAQGRYAEAVSFMRRAVNVQPDHADMRNTLGFFLAQKGELEAALKEFEAALQIDPRNATPFFNMGIVYAKRGELGKSVENFEQALKLDPDNAAFHGELAKILSRQGQAEKADEHFKKAIALDPKLPFCALNTCM